jgi:putative SOS response-associated peptidase YedK
MCNLYSITTNQAAILGLFRVINRYVGNLPPMPGVFPDYPAPVIRNTDNGTEMTLMRWGMPPPSRTGGPPVTNIRNTSSPHWPDGAKQNAPEWTFFEIGRKAKSRRTRVQVRRVNSAGLVAFAWHRAHGERSPTSRAPTHRGGEIG